jgi:hypothetical protein
LTSSPVFDGATQVGYCQLTTGTTVTCPVYGGSVVAAGDTVTATVNGVKNPGTTKQYALKLSTTSDITAKTIPYCVAAAGVPCITKFAPASGVVGAAVTITGINLSAASAVKFNGTTATIATNTATKITTTVPAGATTGTITVTNAGGTATSTKSFTVLP